MVAADMALILVNSAPLLWLIICELYIICVGWLKLFMSFLFWAKEYSLNLLLLGFSKS